MVVADGDNGGSIQVMEFGSVVVMFVMVVVIIWYGPDGPEW